MDEESTHGLSAERLAHLLSIGAEPDQLKKVDRDAAVKADLLRSRLAGAFPLGPGVADSLPALLGRLREQPLPEASRPLGEILLDPGAGTDALVLIKEYGRHLASRAGCSAERAAATVVYYAAIASALVSYGLRVTRHSRESLAESFATLASKTWVPAELVDLFFKARDACRSKTNTHTGADSQGS